MKQRLLTLLLALVLAVSLAVPAAAVQAQPVEVASALELAQTMAAPVSPRWSAAASTSTCRSSRRRSGRRSCPCRGRIAIELLVNFQCL